MLRYNIPIVVVTAICIFAIDGQIFEKLQSQNACVSKTTCRECIQTSNCAWCLQPDYEDKPRCFQASLVPSNICYANYTWNPKFEEEYLSVYELTRTQSEQMAGGGGGGMYAGGSGYEAKYSASSSYEKWKKSVNYGSSASFGKSKDIVQISPQHIKLRLRINEKYNLQMFYSQAEDYPVDLYYLMDLSKSMEDDKEKLSKLGNLLSETMRNITSNFRLGFGSFVDKVLMPYVSTVPKNLISPCDDGCAPPYGFRNGMSLKRDERYEFSRAITDAQVSGNLDAPEGGFDAIMQAIVCRDEIGWRPQARRLLVFSTDAGFHYAGDGKLGGVITPNDGICHLKDNEYTHSKIQDYPSISQINLKVKENAINIIFAVTAQQYGVYQRLSEHIEGSSSAILSNDSSNVVDLVKEEYSKISSSVEMKDSSGGSVKVTYYSSCLNNGTARQTNKCDGLKVGDVVSFTAEIVATSCPKNPRDWKQRFQIYPVGLNEFLTVDLEMLCSCPCEIDPGLGFERKSKKCNFQGDYTCGICECYPQFYGKTCKCSVEQGELDENKDGLGCRPDNTSVTDCNGRGTCDCGVCECTKRKNIDEIISGKYCECDNFSCDRQNGLLCSGPTRGECHCGECVCLPGWTDSDCNCRDSNASCIPPSGGEICSGHGECKCDACRCDSTAEGRYSGKYCEKCPTCSQKCHELMECVQCQMYKTGRLHDENLCKENCTHLFTPIAVETVTVDDDKDEYLCTYYDKDDCRFNFVYSEIDNKLEVRAQQDRECPPKVFMLGIVLGVIAAIVLIGLVFLLLWKMFTSIHDRREFARFEKERMMARWDTGENPIYKQATSTFKNPTYAGK